MERVLVVDDDPAVLEVVCEVLDEAGYEVAGVGHPTVTFALISGVHPDVVLMDLMLPEMDGLELARQLQLKGFADTPMVAMSASGGMLQRATVSGLFQRILPKPFELDEVVGAVECCRQDLPPPRPGLLGLG